MNFSTPDRIASIIENLKTSDLLRAPNRTLINNLFNGAPPYSAAEVQQNNIQWNVNWQEGPDLLLQGREQLENAHLSTDFAFIINMEDAPPSKKSEWSQSATKIVNKLMKKNLPWLHTQREKWGSVILHGTGSQMWYDDEVWRPHFIAIDDLLIPTDTHLTYDNMNHFCAKRRMTSGELYRKTFGKPKDKRDPRWNMKAVAKVFEANKDINQGTESYNWAENPEKLAELYKQNGIWWDSDKVPKILLWDFFYQKDNDPTAGWYREILLDRDCVGAESRESSEPITSLYKSEKPFADQLGHILHTQFIDGNNVAPFMYHSVRGLGMRLFDGCQAINRLRNQSMQKTMEDLMLLFRVQDPSDRARLDQIYMGINYGIVPDGLTFVTRDQRYTIDPNLLQMQLAMIKQLIGEGSQQYTQDIDTGTNKERTAFEVSTLLQQTTRLTGSMLNLSYLQEKFAYEEICRRLTKRGTQNMECKKLQNTLKLAGIPAEWIDSTRWEIDPVRVMGSGNSQIETAQANALMQVRPLMNPEAQQQVLHDYVFAITHDPKRANSLAPLDAAPQVTDSTHDSELVYGALMAGSKVEPKSGLIAAEVVQTMLRLMGDTVQMINAMGGVGTPEKILGLQNAMRYTGAYIQQLAQDEENAQMVKEFGDALGQIGNMVKAFTQRMQEAMQKQQQGNGIDPEAQQKLQSNMAITQQKLQADQAKFEQKMAQNQQKFQQKMMLDMQKMMGDQQRKNLTTLADVRNSAMETAMTPTETPSEEA